MDKCTFSVIESRFQCAAILSAWFISKNGIFPALLHVFPVFLWFIYFSYSWYHLHSRRSFSFLRCTYSAVNHNCWYVTFESSCDLWHNLHTLNKFHFDFHILKYIYEVKIKQWMLRRKSLPKFQWFILKLKIVFLLLFDS